MAGQRLVVTGRGNRGAGDVGHLGTDGHLTLIGRAKYMIICDGEATVIGVPDDKWGAAVVAYVQPQHHF
ncbi:hypothetical protein [Amycolatopsis sp. NPDC059657]|uniref:hypothetical protein n=1 Tax=Amycolatopsis sp. NPDC059657 TaxID=3346899 RepID=UPI00366E79E0